MAVRKWRAIDDAPYGEVVEIQAGPMRFPAKLMPEVSITESGHSCDQWWATTDKHPECWTDGACWESNANEQMSAQPEKWRPLA